MIVSFVLFDLLCMVYSFLKFSTDIMKIVFLMQKDYNYAKRIFWSGLIHETNSFMKLVDYCTGT